MYREPLALEVKLSLIFFTLTFSYTVAISQITIDDHHEINIQKSFMAGTENRCCDFLFSLLIIRRIKEIKPKDSLLRLLLT